MNAPFEESIRPHLPLLRRYATRLDRANAEDLMQETLLRAWRGWHTYTPLRPVQWWLCTIARHAAADQRRYARMSKRRPSGGIISLNVLGEHPDEWLPQMAAPAAEDEVIGRMDRAEFASSLTALRPALRDVVLLVLVDGLSYRRAAALLGVREGTVKSRLHRARQVLQQRLTRRTQRLQDEPIRVPA